MATTVKVANTAAQVRAQKLDIRRYYDLEDDFGAVGDGVTNDRAALVNAIAAMTLVGGGKLKLRANTYRIQGAQIDINSHRIELIGEGCERSILKFDDEATRGVVFDTLGGADSSALSANTAVGDRTVTVADGTKFHAGNWVYLEDVATSTASFVTKVQSVVGNVVTLEDAIPMVITTADTATLFVYATFPFLEGIRVSGIGFQCTAGSASVNKLTLLFLSRCHNAIVDDCHFLGSVGPLVTTRSLRGGMIKNSFFEYALTTAGSGIEVQTSTAFEVRDNSYWMCQFGIVTTASPYCRVVNNAINGRGVSVAAGRGMRLGESSNFSTVSGNIVTDANFFGIYLQDSADCVVDGNQVMFNGVDPQEHGIAVGGFRNDFCKRNRITNNNVVGATGAGIFVQSNNPGEPLYTVITGNTISRCVQRAIFLGSTYNTVTGNYLVGDGNTNFQLLGISASGGHNVVAGNVFDFINLALTAIQSTGGVGFNVIGPNVYNGLTNLLHATDITYLSSAETQQPFPKYSNTVIGTDADLLEKIAWSFAVTANSFSTNGQGGLLTAHLHTAANGNTKTIRVYIGAAVVAAVTTANDEEITITFEWVRTSAAAAFIMIRANRTGGVIVLSHVNSAVDWTISNTVKVTMQNGTAAANDCVFQGGKCSFTGIPVTAYV
jgi:parallel beta-helix repeat protein